MVSDTNKRIWRRKAITKRATVSSQTFVTLSKSLCNHSFKPSIAWPLGLLSEIVSERALTKQSRSAYSASTRGNGEISSLLYRPNGFFFKIRMPNISFCHKIGFVRFLRIFSGSRTFVILDCKFSFERQWLEKFEWSWSSRFAFIGKKLWSKSSNKYKCRNLETITSIFCSKALAVVPIERSQLLKGFQYSRLLRLWYKWGLWVSHSKV